MTVQPGEEKAQGRTHQCAEISAGRMQEWRVRLFSVVPSARARGTI